MINELKKISRKVDMAFLVVQFIKHFHFNATNVRAQNNNVSFAFTYVKLKKITKALTSFIN